jgi:hypothetical protein
MPVQRSEEVKMRKAIIVAAFAAGAVAPFVGISAAFATDTPISDIVIVRPEYETCDYVFVPQSDGSYTVLGKPCNEQLPLVQPEEGPVT